MAVTHVTALKNTDERPGRELVLGGSRLIRSDCRSEVSGSVTVCSACITTGARTLPPGLRRVHEQIERYAAAAVRIEAEVAAKCAGPAVR